MKNQEFKELSGTVLNYSMEHEWTVDKLISFLEQFKISLCIHNEQKFPFLEYVPNEPTRTEDFSSVHPKPKSRTDKILDIVKQIHPADFQSSDVIEFINTKRRDNGINLLPTDEKKKVYATIAYLRNKGEFEKLGYEWKKDKFINTKHIKEVAEQRKKDDFEERLKHNDTKALIEYGDKIIKKAEDKLDSLKDVSEGMQEGEEESTTDSD